MKKPIHTIRATIFGILSLIVGALGFSGYASAQTNPCTGNYILCDDFNGSTLNASKWRAGNTNIAQQYKVRPANIRLMTINDNGTNITVVNAQAWGDQNTVAQRQGGVIITKNRYGGGRYEVRMKNLPGPHGCSCIWNYYDSLNENNPPATRVYTEIDIEMPAHIKPVAPAWAQWRRTFGFNTWSNTDADEDATYINHLSTIDPFDGQFHIYRFDWRSNPSGSRRIDWYVDNVLQASTTQHVSRAPAQLWVGNWPAPWAGMTYNFNVMHQYIDWVRISALP